MKSGVRFAAVVFMTLSFIACKNEEKEGVSSDIINNTATAGSEKDDTFPVITFKEKRIEFGSINEGETVSRKFEFTNTGNTELLIHNVSTSCGCTVADNWPKQPLQPGETAFIEVTFDSKGKAGQQTKRINISANTSPSTNVVALVGFVKTKK